MGTWQDIFEKIKDMNVTEPWTIEELQAPGWIMGTWQDIFEKKIEDMNVTEPWTIEEDDELQVHALRPGWKEFVQRRAFGRFQCSQCLHGWSSARVHILFHMCRSPGWGMVRMRIFRQTCRRCAEPRLEEPQFSEETMEKVLHNLVLKILKYFYHVPIQPSELLEVVVDVPVRGPHDSARCEGCQLGVCSQVKQTPGSQVLDDRKPLMKEKQTPGIQVLDDRKALMKKKKTPGIQVLDDKKPLMKKKKTRTHHVLNSTHTWPNATQTHLPSSVNRKFPWKICCWVSMGVLCVLAVLLFVLIYFTQG